MSATLFHQEQPQQHPLKSDSNSTDTIIAYANGNESASYCSGVAKIDNDMCQELLKNKMSGLTLNDTTAELRNQLQHNYEGSDSGVDTANVNVALQRALSSNSGGYASSNGGLDETTTGMNISCDSSMISCSSDFFDAKPGGGGGGVSENGSESSSVAVASAAVRRSDSIKKKMALFEPAGINADTATSKVTKECYSSASTPVTAGLRLQSMAVSSQARSRVSTIKRTASLPRSNVPLTPQTRKTERQTAVASGRAVNSGNAAMPMSMSLSTTGTPLRSSQTRATKPQKPDSLPSALSRAQSASMQRLIRTPSLSRARTPCTPSDDGRWPGVSRSAATATAAVVVKRGTSVTPDHASVKIRASMGAAANPYSTLPRRRKQKSVEDLTGHGSRSSSITRESRMTSSVVVSTRRNLVGSYGNAAKTAQSSSSSKMLPPATSISSVTLKPCSGRNQQQSTKTRIYHETSVQTALTSEDLEKAFAGDVSAARAVDAAEQRDQQTQSDIHDREMERLRDEVRQMAQREHELNVKLQHEREEKLAIQRELHLNTERVMGMLELARVAGGDSGTPTSEDGSGHDSLLMLESQIQISGHELVERQQEIGQLRLLCRSLQHEMQRSLVAQECLLQEKAAIEQESSELQDFLQHEKTAMCEALKELEVDFQECKRQLSSRDEEVKVLRDECRHLVRLNEQRRQENRMLQTKYAALEGKTKDLILQQNTSVTGASTALCGLHARLDKLVEQLVSSYSISEQDLEDIAFQNDVQTHIVCDASNDNENQLTKTMTTNSSVISGTCGDLTSQMSLMSQSQHRQMLLNQTSDGSLSPQRNQSFIAAVISAIRNATTPSGKRLLTRNVKRSCCNQSNANNNNNHNERTSTNGDDDSDSTEMLDSETEPCLMMDNVLEDVTMPDSHSHNMVSSCTGMISQIDVPSELVNAASGDESLHNLSQAIANRQQMELQVNAMTVQKANLQLNTCESISEDISCHDSVAEMPSLMEYSGAQAVVDQVIEVDHLVTKLLKVLRLIQMDNDNCIQQLIVDKNKLQQNKEDMLEKLKDVQDANIKLQDELMDATQELLLKNNDLSSTKAEMQRHRNEIDVRF